MRNLTWVDMPPREYTVYSIDEDWYPHELGVFANWADAQAFVTNNSEHYDLLKLVGSEDYENFWANVPYQ